jgi:hypothetical protein
VPLRVAAPVGQHAQQLDLLLLQERRTRSVNQEIGRRDRRLVVIELGEAHLGIGIDEGLLLDSPDPFRLPRSQSAQEGLVLTEAQVAESPGILPACKIPHLGRDGDQPTTDGL